MGVFDFIKKKKGTEAGDDVGQTAVSDASGASKTDKANINDLMQGVDTSNMSTMQKMAFKMFKRLSPDKQQEVMRQAMNPQNIQKNKAQILKQIDEMVKSGQIDKGQAEAIKSQMGLR